MSGVTEKTRWSVVSISECDKVRGAAIRDCVEEVRIREANLAAVAFLATNDVDCARGACCRMIHSAYGF